MLFLTPKNYMSVRLKKQIRDFRVIFCQKASEKKRQLKQKVTCFLYVVKGGGLMCYYKCGIIVVWCQTSEMRFNSKKQSKSK